MSDITSVYETKEKTRAEIACLRMEIAELEEKLRKTIPNKTLGTVLLFISLVPGFFLLFFVSMFVWYFGQTIYGFDLNPLVIISVLIGFFVMFTYVYLDYLFLRRFFRKDKREDLLRELLVAKKKELKSYSSIVARW